MKTVTKVVSAALLAAAVTVTNAAEIKWSGAAQYRARMDIDMGTTNDETTGKEIEKKNSYNRYNKYAWKLGMKASINENLGFGLQFENKDGYIATGTIGSNTKFSNGVLRVSQAYMAVKKGIFHTNLGIIPVNGNTVLDLAWYVDNKGVAYENDGVLGGIENSNGWGVSMGASQAGAEIGFDLGESASINLVAATQTKDGIVFEDQKDDDKTYDDIRFFLNAPIKIGGATLTPAFTVLSGADGSWTSLSTTGGVDVNVKAGDVVTINAGVAVGGYYGDGTDQPLGILGIVKPSFKLGDKMSLTTGLSYGNGRFRAEEVEAKDGQEAIDATVHHQIHFDVKYGIKPIDNFTIMPRLRGWFYSNSDEDDNSTDQRIRPEILFIASF